MADEDLYIYQGHRFNHLRNVWFEKIETFLAKKLESHLKHDLDLISPHIRISCKLSDLLWQCDKEFSGCCNYVKGSSHDFLYYREQHHLGKEYLPIIRDSSHDNCHGANKAGTLLAINIIEQGKKEGMVDEDLHVYQGHCFNHLHNV